MSDRIYHTATDARCLDLMQQIADEAARYTLVSKCRYVVENDLAWFVLHDKVRAEAEYLALRNLIEYDSTGRLVRFVGEGK